MAFKIVELPPVGRVKIQKRRGTRRIKLRINQKQEVVVSQPPWLPYAAGIEFAKAQTNWLLKHLKPQKSFHHGQMIGKNHTLYFVSEVDRLKPRVIVTKQDIRIYHPLHWDMHSEANQHIIVRGAKKALVHQQAYLVDKLERLAAVHEVPYKNVYCKFMVSKWGSRHSDGSITLNYRLLDLPDDLIEYVIIHELAHARHMNHSRQFWSHVETMLPDYIARRRQLKEVNLAWHH